MKQNATVTMSRNDNMAWGEHPNKLGVYIRYQGIDAEAYTTAVNFLDKLFSDIAKPETKESAKKALAYHSTTTVSNVNVYIGEEKQAPVDLNERIKAYLNHKGRYCGHLSDMRREELKAHV